MKYLEKNIVIRLILSLAAGYLILRLFQGLSLLRNARVWLRKLGLVDIGPGFLILFALVVIAIILFAVWSPGKLQFLKKFTVSIRQRLGFWRWLVVISAFLVPVKFLLFTGPGVSFTDPYLRFFIGFSACFLMAAFITYSETDLIQPSCVVFAVLLYGSAFVFASHLTYVRNYPFSLTWSEGNRLYDYSVILGSNRYQYTGPLTIPYDNPGRYILWGVLFAFPNTPIWLHRLWDAILSTVPHILFGYLLARWSHLGKLDRISLAFGIFLFLYQGPIYAPLIISAIIIVLAVNQRRMWLSLIGVTIAGAYASLSRWTWLPAPAIWAVLLLVSDFEWQRDEPWKYTLRRLVPMAIVALVGLLAGILVKADFFAPEELASTKTFGQPLLWYRLFPNATFSNGILLALLYAAGPVVGFIIWGGVSRWWGINLVQGIVYLLASLVTLIVGLVISVKIGGGADLHNLDMFLITQAILIGLMIKGRSELSWKTWPVPVQALFALAVIILMWSAQGKGRPLQLPTAMQIGKGLETTKREVARAKLIGEVLFMDQRQLLTFGYIRDVPLVPDYEKKFVMDMAMGNNKEYFESFYSDLARKRFALIVSEPLKVVEKGLINSFGEENDAWVKWVSNPILCYYEPIKTWKSIKVQLLTPRPNPVDCP